MDKNASDKNDMTNTTGRNGIFMLIGILMPISMIHSHAGVLGWVSFTVAYLFLISTWHSFLVLNKKSFLIEANLDETSRSKFVRLRQEMNFAAITSIAGIGIAFAMGIQLGHR